VISGFCCKVDENCVLLGYYTASSGNYIVILNTVDYNQKIGAFLEGPSIEEVVQGPHRNG